MDMHGKWEAIKELGEGGQGKVYLVKDTTKTGETDKTLARIKRLVPGLASAQSPEKGRNYAEDLVKAILSFSTDPAKNSSSLGALKILHKPTDKGGYDKALERMKQEIDALNAIKHPNALRILDHSIKEGWFVGEYHPGKTLWDNKEIFKGDMLRALTAFRPLVEVVVQLHKGGRVHRDIKPHNVFIAADGRLVLGDFGIVHFDDPNRTRVTDTYENVGSHNWMPAWAAGRRIEDITPAFDVFGLGKLLWAMLSGRSLLPFWYHHKRENELEEMFPADESIRWARTILDKCIVEDEENCLRSAVELMSEIDTVLPVLKRHGQILSDTIERRCTVCGIGRYQSIANENMDDIRNFGLEPRGSTFKIFSCSHCAHVELFHIGNPNSKPMAWRKV